MERTFGKLILIQEGGPEQEFELAKASITLGRAMTNDIVLGDSRISRSHARLLCGPSGCRVIDLDSANGIRVNGNPVKQAELMPGDSLNLGNLHLRYESTPPLEDEPMTMIDSEFELDRTIDHEILPVSIHETGHPSLVVFTGERTWEVPLRDVERVTVGRTEGNDIAIEHPKVSRRHAELLRQGDGFLLRDLGSTNGTWCEDERVTERFLQPGDSFTIGAAQLVFKSGFTHEALTIADEAFSRPAARHPRRPVVFVPGMMGSELWRGSERVWPNVKHLFRNPEVFRYPSPAPLEPRGIVDQVIIVPNLIKLDQYNRLGDYLVEELKYERGVDFFEFAYDWRQDVRISARQLGQLVENLPVSAPVTILAHSLGTMVSRYYIDHLGGRQRVERAVLMGGPHQGAVKGLTSLLIAPEVLPFGLLGERLRQVVATFPTSYQIIPTYPCATDQNGEKINFLEYEDWVAPEQRPMLRAAAEFRRELGRGCSVPAISIFGYGIKTVASVTLNRSPEGKLSNILYQSEPGGDSTILERSAALEGTEIHPVQQYHGSLFADNDVRMRLKLELSRQFSNPG